MYNIVVRYRTGDTFKQYDTDTTLGNWNLETAKENLKRIREHYKYYSDRNQYVSMAMKNREDDLFEKLQQERFFTSMSGWPWSIKLLEDDGTQKEYTVEWCGYFERLYGADIKAYNAPEDDDMSFEI
jgi:hypothetical protein